VAIDSPAGPSELLVIADSSAHARVIANEILAQAEHDPRAAVIVLVTGANCHQTCTHISNAVEALLQAAARSSVIRSSLSSRGALLAVESLDAAIHFANEWAAEHLLVALAADDQQLALSKLRSAGTVFLGESSSVAFGDYMTGANHVLPTAGLARCYSGLSTMDFIRWTTWQRVTTEAACSLSRDVAVFADAEGLAAHANAARHWSTPVSSQSQPS
jgi:histidinol dehydrogenase